MSKWNLTLANSFAENLKSYKTSFSKMEKYPIFEKLWDTCVFLAFFFLKRDRFQKFWKYTLCERR